MEEGAHRCTPYYAEGLDNLKSTADDVWFEVGQWKMISFLLGGNTMERIRDEDIRATAQVKCCGDKVRE